VNVMRLMQSPRAALKPEPSISHEHRWPVAAHPWFGGAFPFCAMTLCPSAHEAMLEQLLGTSEPVRQSVFRQSDDVTAA